MKNNENGNVLVYVLIAVGLMAAITFAVSRDGGGQQAERMDDTRADLLATQLIQHVASAEQVIYHMTQWGTDYADLKFDLPGTVDYNTDVTNQVYHPQGGGLQVPTYSDDVFEGSATRGWQWQNLTNVEWSPTIATDLIYSFVDVSRPICEKINEELLASSAVPIMDGGLSNRFIHDVMPNGDFAVSVCTECENIKSMCVSHQTGTRYAFYTIIGSR